MSYPVWIYPEWTTPDDFDGPEDYADACEAAEWSYDLANSCQACDTLYREHGAGGCCDDCTCEVSR